MRADRLAILRCPVSGSPLTLSETSSSGGEIVSGKLISLDGAVYPIEQGVLNFLRSELLSPVEVETQAEYDRVAEEIYDVAVDWQFASLFEDENTVRESMVDMLHPAPGAQVLEVGCGTGRDSFRLARRLGPDGYLHLQDLSPGMVHTCVRKMSEYSRTAPFTCGLDYSVSSALSLPFADETFDAVFHFGGFNQFGNLPKAAAELARVTKLGGRVVFGDEAVAPWLKGTEFEGIVTTNNALFKFDAPLGALPVCARDVTIRWVMANCFYIVGFTKDDGPPPLNLDLPHKGWRGGTMRTRYFGLLEGVSLEAKALARKAADQCGLSVHEWLDRLVTSEALKDLETSKRTK
jgi:SAM-dependent methyltransferase